MRVPLALLTVGITALAQSSPGLPDAAPGATIAGGVPLRVAIEKRVAIHRAGEPFRGRLVEPVYVFDRMALPAGTVVEGHISEIGGVPAGRRIAAILSGNFTPKRDARAQFDAVISGGVRISLSTVPSRGTAHTTRLSTPSLAAEGRKSNRQGSDETNRAAVLAFRTPGKMSRLKSRLFSMLPYHRQAWTAGTLFDGVLLEPLVVPQTGRLEAQSGDPAVAGPEPAELRARLVTPLSSATAQKGTTVEAVVTRPVFSPAHTLLIPEGCRITGSVREVRPARFLHRNGKLLFSFQQITLPSGKVQSIQGGLEGFEADFDASLSLDSEGGARVRESKTRFVFPAIAATVAGLSLHQDVNAQGVPDQDIGGRAESGAVGLGLVGTVLAQASRPLASSIAFVGAGFSIYSTFIAHGRNVVFPANTPLRINLRERGSGSGSGPMQRNGR